MSLGLSVKDYHLKSKITFNALHKPAIITFYLNVLKVSRYSDCNSDSCLLLFADH